MKVSIRPGTTNNMPALYVYRQRARTGVLATAVQTKSGRWIVYRGYGQMADVADDAKAAETMLHEFFEKLGEH